MELVRACSLTGYFAVAEQLGLDVTPLLRRAGLTRSMMSNPEQMLPARSVVQLLEDSASASGCVTFGLRMAAERRVSDIGKVSLLIVHQPTLRDSLDVLSEFRNRLNSHLTLQIEEHGDTVFLRQHFALNPPMVSRQVNDAALGVHYNLCRTMMGDDWRPQSVCLSYERPMSPDRAIYDRLFRLPNPVRGGFRRDYRRRERHGASASTDGTPRLPVTRGSSSVRQSTRANGLRPRKSSNRSGCSCLPGERALPGWPMRWGRVSGPSSGTWIVRGRASATFSTVSECSR